MKKIFLILIIVTQCLAMLGCVPEWRQCDREGLQWQTATIAQAVEPALPKSASNFEGRVAVSALTRSDLPPFDMQPINETGRLLRASASGQATQRDPDFNPIVARPAYTDSHSHPKVLIDEAHNNADTSRGRYKPFADLIVSDGYEVAPNVKKLSRETLSGKKILIIVNAQPPAGQLDRSPFDENELGIVRDWVKMGGGLLLITDQSPYSAAARALSTMFEVDITQGYTIDTANYNKESEDQTELVFTRDSGLVEHAITQGREASEQIKKVITFSGTSLKGPPKSVPFLRLADTAKDILPPDRTTSSAPDEPLPEHKPVSAAGRAQGIALEFGIGRIVVLADAAMLTAQTGFRGYRFGMNVTGVDNKQLGLNIMHWLSGLLK
jgi:hypothetical protein